MQQVKHECELTESRSWISDYNVRNLQSLWLQLRIVSERSAKYSLHYRSKAAIRQEIKRQCELPHTFILHPFSHFRFIWETFMIFVYIIAFFIIPFEACNIFYSYINPINFMPVLGYIVIPIHCINIMDIIFNFKTGYVDSKMNQVVLDPKLIARKYLKTYFILDVLSTIPALMNAITMYFGSGKPVYDKLMFLNLLRIGRHPTFSVYTERLAMRYNFLNLWFYILGFLLNSFFFFHWCACILFILPFIYTTVTTFSNNTWIHEISSKLDELSVKELYINSFFVAIILTLTCSASNRALTEFDFALAIIFAFIGILYISWLFVLFLNLIRSKFEPETKYDEFITQLHDYNQHNQLPLNIQKRMYLFYEYRYQRTYFKEDTILNTLSSHICNEIHEHCCRRLMAKNRIFDNLTPLEYEEIIENFTGKVYLPKDVIVKFGATAKYIYFVSYGTLAVYTASGKEVYHLWDGCIFGEEPLVMKSHNFMTNVIAIEICEVYQLEYDTFLRYIPKDTDSYREMLNTAKRKIREARAIEAIFKKTYEPKSKSELDVIMKS